MNTQQTPRHTPVLHAATLTAILSSMLASSASAQNAATAPAGPDMMTSIAVLLISLSILIVLLLLILAMLIDTLLRRSYGTGLFPALAGDLGIGRLWDRMVGLRPASPKVVLDAPLHHDYDGIEELDNGPPPIFNYILYGSIVFAVVYVLRFHVFEAAPTQDQEYQEELQVALRQRAEREGAAANKIDETTVQLSTKKEDLDAGKAVFAQHCVVCHGDKGEGKIGPNLTDKYWLHGGSINDVFRTVKIGVPAKGMIAWQSVLNPTQMAEVSSYILSLQGTNPPNAKKPEGEPYVPKAVEPKPDSSKATPANKKVALAH